jgi:hypothetical protein
MLRSSAERHRDDDLAVGLRGHKGRDRHNPVTCINDPIDRPYLDFNEKIRPT